MNFSKEARAEPTRQTLFLRGLAFGATVTRYEGV